MPSQPKQIAFDDKARAATAKGVGKLARAVKTTLGPAGRCAVIDRGWGEPLVSRDGAKVAQEVDLADPYENMACRLIRQAAEKTSKQAGDGSTTATVLAEALYRHGARHIAAGTAPALLTRGMRAAVQKAVETIRKASRPVKSSDQVRSVATVAANHDREIGKIIATAIEKVGKDGVITIEEGKSIDSSVKVVEGMKFDRGYLSPHFVTDAEKMECELKDPYVLIYEEKISTLTKILPLLEKILASKKPLLIIAEDVEGEVLATLVVNRMKGVLPCAAVKAPAYGDRRKAMLRDLAILTGATAIMKDMGLELDQVQLDHLGRARRIEITSEDTTIVKGAGGREAIDARAAEIRKELETTTSDYDREKLEERLAKLVGGVAVVEVGAATESDMKERKGRFESALSATRAAQEEGLVAGGGVALFRASQALQKLELDDEEEQRGVEAVRRALEAPLRQLCENAGVVPATVIRNIRKERNRNTGYDLIKDEFVDMLESGIADPAKVARSALENAMSVAALLLTSDTLVASIPEEEDDDAHDHHDDMMDEF